MTTPSCLICSRLSEDGKWAVCQSCEDHMRRQLRHLPGDAAQIQAELYEWRTAPPGGSRTGDPAEGALPGGTDLLSASATLLGRYGATYDTLASWDACWREEREMPPRDHPPTLEQVCEFLSVHLTWACRDFLAIDSFAQELRESVKIAKDVLAEERQWVRLGRFKCPITTSTLTEDEEPAICAGQLWRDHTDEQFPAIVCRSCTARWEREAWDQLGAVFDVAVSSRDAAAFVGVSERTMQRWIKDGKMPNYNGRVKIADLAFIGRAA